MSEENTSSTVKTITISRRVYVQHKLHGTCVSYAAKVYLAPAGFELDKKAIVNMDFTVGDGILTDSEGRAWTLSCENPGCGPRLPKDLKALHGAAFAAMNRAEREAFVKALKPAKS